MNDIETTSAGSNSNQNGSSPYLSERESAVRYGNEEFDQERGERDISDNELGKDKN